MKKTISNSMILGLSALSLIACSTTNNKPEAQIKMEEKRTLLDNHMPEIKAVEARMILQGFQGAITNKESEVLKEFANDYFNKGRGSIVIAYPHGAMLDGSTDVLVREAQRKLFLEGVDFSKMSFAPYNAVPNTINAVVLSYARYDITDVECKPWSEIDAKAVSGNLSTERFGCAQKANLAQMLVDPGDLKGDRKNTLSDADKALVGIDKYRQGELEKASGSVTGSGGN